MNMEQLVKIGAEAFQSSIGQEIAQSLSTGEIMSALAGLMPGDGKNVDLGALIGNMKSSGLASIAQSWLGDGANRGIDAAQVLSMFGSGSISQFASQLGIDQDTAIEGLKGAVPEMVDKASSDGALGKFGGISGVMGMAGKLFGR